MTADSSPPHPRPPVARPRVIVTRRLRPATEARLGELFDTALSPDDEPLDRAALVAAMRRCDVLVPTVTDRIDAAMLAQAGGRIGLIANFGAGTDNIDLAAARRHGIVVTNTPGVFTEDTADLTLLLIIAAARRAGDGARTLRAGEWSGWKPSGPLGFSLGGKQLGILGMGRIGQAVARRAAALGMTIAYYNRNRLPAPLEESLAARYEPDPDRLIAQADVLTLHCPSNPDTRHVLDARRIAAMKPGACLVNTARGDLVDEAALVAALREGRLGGAGLDVFTGEPQVDPALLAAPGVVALPHLGSATREGREAAGDRIIANIRAWADGHRPRDQVLDGWL